MRSSMRVPARAANDAVAADPSIFSKRQAELTSWRRPGQSAIDQRRGRALPTRIRAPVLSGDRAPVAPVPGLPARRHPSATGKHRARRRETEPALEATRAQGTAAALLRLRGLS